MGAGASSEAVVLGGDGVSADLGEGLQAPRVVTMTNPSAAEDQILGNTTAMT